MKRKTRLLTWILAVLLIVSSVLLVACVDKPTAKQLTELTLPELKDNQMAVIIKNGDSDYTCYTVTLTDELKSGEDVINYLTDKAQLKVDWQESTFGKYINGIGGATVTAANEYVAIFTSVEAEKGAGAGAAEYTIGDVTVGYSQVGISEMTVGAGVVFYFETETF